MPTDEPPVGVEPEEARTVLRQSIEEPRLGEQHGHARVLHHEGEPVFRIRRIERQVGAARLQDAEQPDDHVERALGEDADEDVGADACGDEIVRELIRAPVELSIRQALGAGDDGDLLGALRGLTLEHLRDRPRRIRPGGRVEAAHDLGSFARGHHAEPGDRHPRVGDDTLQQRFVMRRHPRNRRLVEEVRVELPPAAQRVVEFRHQQHEVVDNGLLRHLRELEQQATQFHLPRALVHRQRQRLVVAPMRLVEGEQRVQQRTVTRISFGPQTLHQQRKRIILVLERAEHGLPHPPEQLGKRRIPREIASKRHGVQAVANDVLKLGPRAPRHRRADDDVGFAGVAREQHLEGRQEHGEEGVALRLRQFPQAPGKAVRDLDGVGRAARGLHGRPRAIDRQRQRGKLAGHLRLPVVPETLAVRAGQHVRLPVRERLVGMRRRQRRFAAFERGRVEDAQLVEQRHHRPQVVGDVMQGHEKDRFAAHPREEPHPQDGAALEVERAVRLVRDAASQFVA